MEISFLQRDEIDDGKWDACIYDSFNSLVYAYTWYLDNVADDWSALVLDNYKAVMPLPQRKKWGFTYIYQPFFCQQLGVFSNAEISQEMVDAFFKAIPAHFSFVDIQANIFTKPEVGNIVTKQKTNHRLPLISTYEKLEKGYNENTKRNIKKAKKAKIELLENAEPSSIIKLYRENYGHFTPEVKEEDYQRLNRLVNACLKMGVLKAWAAFDEHNSLCGGCLFINDHKNVYYILGGATDEGKEKGALFAIFNGFIETKAGQDLVLDFEGSEIEGIARFYRGLGAKPVYYYNVQQNRLPYIIRWLKKVRN